MGCLQHAGSCSILCGRAVSHAACAASTVHLLCAPVGSLMFEGLAAGRATVASAALITVNLASGGSGVLVIWPFCGAQWVPGNTR